MSGHVVKNIRERSDSNWIVVGDCNVMRSVFRGGEADVASCLSRNLVAKRFQSFYQFEA